MTTRPNPVLQNHLESAVLAFDTDLIERTLRAGADVEARASWKMEQYLNPGCTEPLTVAARVTLAPPDSMGPGMRKASAALWEDVKRAVLARPDDNPWTRLPLAVPEDQYTGPAGQNTVLDAIAAYYLDQAPADDGAIEHYRRHQSAAALCTLVLQTVKPTRADDLLQQCEAFCARQVQHIPVPSAAGESRLPFQCFHAIISLCQSVTPRLRLAIERACADSGSPNHGLLATAMRFALKPTRQTSFTLLQQMLDAGFAIDGQDCHGDTAVMAAASLARLDGIQWALNAGADWRATNSDGVGVHALLQHVAHTGAPGLVVQAEECRAFLHSWAARNEMQALLTMAPAGGLSS